MENVSALHNLIEIISTQDIIQMKKWSERRRYDNSSKQLLRYLREKVKGIRQILVILSGNDVIEMLKGKLMHLFLFLIFLQFHQKWFLFLY